MKVLMVMVFMKLNDDNDCDNNDVEEIKKGEGLEKKNCF